MKTKRESPSKKKKISELDSAELKFRAFLNKRDEINEQAFIVRSERDSLHDKKRELQEPMRAARDKRDAAVAEMRVHKKKRDELQAKAKELIEFKRSVRGAPLGDLKKEVRVVEADIKIMELKQQTVPLKLTEERELLEKIKARAGDLQRIKKLLADQEKIQKEVKDVDASIDALFKFADKEHSEVVRLSEEQHKFHEEAQAYAKEIGVLAATANKKHEEFIKLKEEADAVHQKAMELRGKVIEIKDKKRAEVREERNAIRDVNLATRKALDDKDKKDRAADEALQTLLKKGKIQI
jgi:uncharacterized coiled-coil DUF342 family protein